ncbi:MAG: hypothetical protein AAGU27_26885 [Dehalobacterium sp.]
MESETFRKGYPDGINGPRILEEQYQYDLAGNLTWITDPRNNVAVFQYDALDRLEKVTDALGQKIDYQYNRLGNLSQTRQYEGGNTVVTLKQYDERGSLISNRLPGGETTAIKYHAVGLPSEVEDALGKTTTMQYAPDGRLYEN